MDASVIARVRTRLAELYGDRAELCLQNLLQLAERYEPSLPRHAGPRWTQRDIVLITYADQVRSRDRSALHALHLFLMKTGLDQLLSTVHILPFFPYSSDDGFSVIDYRAVDQSAGTWDDVRRLGQDFDLMFDLVLNHVSQKSHWFREFLAGNENYLPYFIDLDPGTDLSAVVRPRSLPLLTPFQTSRGTRHVWTTFSADQVDLNFADPAVLVEMVDILLYYVQQGARIVRLDAIAYLWKQVGTSCIHLSQTHTVVKLFRDLLEALAPNVLLLTETNVPHEENVSYFGAGDDEAHMVYQFSLPPLLLEAFLSKDTRPVMRWLESLEAAGPGTTYFNFTASHDGIGVRPLEGLLESERFRRLIEETKARGGLVSTRRLPDGADSPYELNITYLDALGEPGSLEPELHARRFLVSQAVMLALRGIPGIYFHSLVGTRNDHAGVKQSGQARRINRRKFYLEELMEAVSSPGSVQNLVFEGYRRLLETRFAQPAFHPDAEQEVWDVREAPVVAFLRSDQEQGQRILVLANVSDRECDVDISQARGVTFTRDLLGAGELPSRTSFTLKPYQVAWLEAGA